MICEWFDTMINLIETEIKKSVIINNISENAKLKAEKIKIKQRTIKKFKFKDRLKQLFFIMGKNSFCDRPIVIYSYVIISDLYNEKISKYLIECWGKWNI